MLRIVFSNYRVTAVKFVWSLFGNSVPCHAYTKIYYLIYSIKLTRAFCEYQSLHLRALINVLYNTVVFHGPAGDGHLAKAIVPQTALRSVNHHNWHAITFQKTFWIWKMSRFNNGFYYWSNTNKCDVGFLNVLLLKYIDILVRMWLDCFV